MTKASPICTAVAVLSVAGTLACGGEGKAPTANDTHQAFVSLVNELKEKLQKGELRQPDNPPPCEGDVLVAGFGWIRPEVFDFCLTLKPVELKNDAQTFRLILIAPERFHEVVGRWDARWDAERWAVEMEKEDRQWRIIAVRALVPKPTAQSPSPSR